VDAAPFRAALLEFVRARAVEEQTGEDRSWAYLFTNTVDTDEVTEDGGIAVVARGWCDACVELAKVPRNHPHKPIVSELDPYLDRVVASFVARRPMDSGKDQTRLLDTALQTLVTHLRADGMTCHINCSR
jgi:hypothetical protein